ncbi:MAG: NAD-dependent epimerase/dehydratase family protein [Lentimicrobium sp.]|jgi:nucleoside-diphosphate-sugar epimerase|uniref:NAD-dependent epimerase/dehydratase family protein n=1 Tax=Lentimicrobium sp. TaxID=2034841 RepID=UPI0025EE4ADD|nr:NAD-dependent epimerase/dehydratase family protein [Lentimicrobium sp.]MCO5256579.1 NAD-dependent epimerase/dehydratase family protein [Lentimicrobium sp.]
MQTILGAGGAIGKKLAKELTAYTKEIRLVSRNPKAINPDDQLMKADLTVAGDVDRAVAGSEIIYLTVGVEYSAKAWQQKWPLIMRNVLDSCIRHQAKLVFFDNVYTYDRNHLGNMTEETPVRPSSKKGEVRNQVVNMLLDEMNSGRITALIARAADFIGPANSVLIEMVYKNFTKGKKANWFSQVDKVHSFTHTDDAARGTAILGNTPDAYGEVWHLPTSDERITGKEWIALFAGEMNVAPKYSTLPDWMLALLGLFIPVLKELKEMAYQYDRDYFFDSSKFNRRFSYVPIRAEEGVRELVKSLKAEN